MVQYVHVSICPGGGLEPEKTYPGRFMGPNPEWNTVVDKRPGGIVTPCMVPPGVCGGSAADTLGVYDLVNPKYDFLMDI